MDDESTRVPGEDAGAWRGRDWVCAAYDAGPGERVPTVLAQVCFVEQARDAACASLVQCQAEMTAERQRIFRLIQAAAARGEEWADGLESGFAAPDDMLGGGNDSGPPRDGD
jgi:hypothetical protein